MPEPSNGEVATMSTGGRETGAASVPGTGAAAWPPAGTCAIAATGLSSIAMASRAPVNLFLPFRKQRASRGAAPPARKRVQRLDRSGSPPLLKPALLCHLASPHGCAAGILNRFRAGLFLLPGGIRPGHAADDYGEFSRFSGKNFPKS